MHGKDDIDLTHWRHWEWPVYQRCSSLLCMPAVSIDSGPAASQVSRLTLCVSVSCDALLLPDAGSLNLCCVLAHTSTQSLTHPLSHSLTQQQSTDPYIQISLYRLIGLWCYSKQPDTLMLLSCLFAILTTSVTCVSTCNGKATMYTGALNPPDNNNVSSSGTAICLLTPAC